MHYKQVANRRKEKWQTGGRDKCLSAAEPSEVLKVWLIRLPSFCVDGSDSVPNLPLQMKNIGKTPEVLFTSYMAFVLPTLYTRGSGIKCPPQ